MSQKTVANIISRTFDFTLWAPIILVISVLNTGLTTAQINTLTPTLALVNIIFPVSLYIYLRNKGKISDIDITNRHERHLLFGISSASLLLSTIFVYYLGNLIIFVIIFITFMTTLSMFVINLKWKISGHMIINSSVIFIINYIFDWKYLWLFILIPFVAYSRWFLKKHSIAQIIAGVMLGILEPLMILKNFNLI